MREKQRQTWSKMQMRCGQGRAGQAPGGRGSGRRAGWPASLTSCSGAIIYFNSAAAAAMYYGHRARAAHHARSTFFYGPNPTHLKCRIRPEYISPPFRSALGSPSASGFRHRLDLSL